MGYVNLVGKRFGSLDVVEDSGKRASTKILWRCKCVNCGEDLLVRTDYLKGGKARCPGCAAEAIQERAPEEVAEAVLIERRYKSKVQQLRAEKAALVSAYEELTERESFLVELRAILDASPPSPIVSRERVSGLREATPVICASDWHAGEVVDLAKTAGKNRFNLTILRLRAARFFEGIKWLVRMYRENFAIRDLILWLGGDFISGYIHEELMESAELSPIYACAEIHSILYAGIHSLLDDLDLERLVIPCNYGNHGRSTKKYRITTGAENSFEHGMYLYLARDFADDPRVEFRVCVSELEHFKVYDFMTRWMHGNGIRYNKGIGGVSVPLNRAMYRWDTVERVDITTLGHFHQYNDSRKFVINGSLVGYSTYAMANSYEYERPMQAFYMIDSKRGKCLSTPIWVDDVEAEGEVE